MELLAILVFIAIAGIAFGALRAKRKREARAQLADLRSAADTASLFILGAAAMQGLRSPGDDAGFAAHDTTPDGSSYSDFGGGFDGGGFGGEVGGG